MKVVSLLFSWILHEIETRSILLERIQPLLCPCIDLQYHSILTRKEFIQAMLQLRHRAQYRCYIWCRLYCATWISISASIQIHWAAGTGQVFYVLFLCVAVFMGSLCLQSTTQKWNSSHQPSCRNIAWIVFPNHYSNKMQYWLLIFIMWITSLFFVNWKCIASCCRELFDTKLQVLKRIYKLFYCIWCCVWRNNNNSNDQNLWLLLVIFGNWFLPVYAMQYTMIMLSVYLSCC